MVGEQNIGIVSILNSWLTENEGVVSLFVSVCTVFISIVAIVISFNIANRQNKIGLFEKRYNIYEKYIELKTFREGLKITTLPPGIEENPLNWRGLYISIILSKGTFNKETSNLPVEFKLIEQSKKDIALLEQISYLFPLNKEDKIAVGELLSSYEDIFKMLLDTSLSIKEARDNFADKFDKHFPKIIEVIEKNLNYR